MPYVLEMNEYGTDSTFSFLLSDDKEEYKIEWNLLHKQDELFNTMHTPKVVKAIFLMYIPIQDYVLLVNTSEY